MNRELRRLNRELKHRSAYVRREAASALAEHDPGPQRRRLSRIHRHTTGALVRVMQADEDGSVRAAAAETLLGYSDPVAQDAVLDLLRSPDPAQSATDIAVRILGLSAPEPVFRAAAALLLRGDGSADLSSLDEIELLVALIEKGAAEGAGERSPIVMAVAPRVASIGDVRGIPALVRVLLPDQAIDPGSTQAGSPLEVRQRAARDHTLWFIRENVDGHGVLVSEAPGPLGRALASFGAPAGDALLAAVGAAPDLSDDVLRRAAGVLAEIAHAAPETIAAGLAGSEPAVVRLSAGAVGTTFQPDWMPGLVAAASSPEANVRATALAALGRIATSRPVGEDALEQAVGCLLDHLTDDSLEPRRAALNALREVGPGNPTLVPRVEGLVRERPMLLPRLVSALASDPSLIELVASLIAAGTPDERRYALIAVREAAQSATAALLRSESLEGAVTAATRDDDPTVQSLAAAAQSALRDVRQPTGAFAPGTALGYPAMDEKASKRRRRWRLPFRRARRYRLDSADVVRHRLRERDLRVLGNVGIGSLGYSIDADIWSADRYPDVSLFTDAPTPQPISPEAPLIEATWYRLEVATRSLIRGLPIGDGEREPLPALPEDAETARLLVATDSDDFEIEDPLGHITLPTEDGDSVQNAWFRVRPRRATPTGESARIELRLYYEYNLVEVILMEAEVRPRLGGARPAPAPGARPLTTIQVSRERDLADLGKVAPRSMHISVERAGDRYALTFAFPGESGETVLRGVTAVGADDLDSELVTVREMWRDIALSSQFADEVTPSPSAAEHELLRLVDAGWRLWTMLFRRQAGSGLARIGELLQSHPLKPGAMIQISVGPEAGTFAFPWALLYDRDRPAQGEEPDREGFWGARYVIEHGVPGLMRGTDTPASTRASRLDFAYMLWNRFRNANEHGLMLAALEAAAGGRLHISAPPVADADTCLDLLEQGDNDILYFYTHGFTRRRSASLTVTDELDRLKRWYERLDPDDPHRVSLRWLYETLTDGAPVDRSYISFPFSRLYLDDLYGSIWRLRRSPVVLLNMCESAQVSPTLSDSFVHFFLDRGARAVIGTECSMTVSFAHPFAEDLLRSLFWGSSIGEALLSARQSFLHDACNPLGLAYTLYGSATTSFIPPLFNAGVQDLDHERSTA